MRGGEGPPTQGSRRHSRTPALGEKPCMMSKANTMMGALSRFSGVSGFLCQREERRYAAARVDGEAIDDGK